MKPLIAAGILIVSFASTGNAAMVASSNLHHKVAHVVHRHAPIHVAPRSRHAGSPLYFDVNQFVRAMLGGPLPPQYARIVQDAMKELARHRSSGSSRWSPSYDNSSSVDSSSAASESQAASDAENQAIQQMNDTNAMNASNAAAAEQNAADSAATTQTEVNAGM